MRGIIDGVFRGALRGVLDMRRRSAERTSWNLKRGRWN
jgi:hypothetical protein